MKKTTILVCLFSFSFVLTACNDMYDNVEKFAQGENAYNLNVKQWPVRDPFIFVDKNEKMYYLHVSETSSIGVYKSKDLKQWKKISKSFVPDPAFWGTKDFWAPDVIFYKGKYYLFVTFSSVTQKRGTGILVSDTVTGPFRPLKNEASTPTNWTCLDATLHIDSEGNPWLLYCHEWIETRDGQMVAQRLSPDLKEFAGEPLVLFSATEAPWVGSIMLNEYEAGYVTDAPFIYKSPVSDKLFMLWSSFDKNGKYAIGLAESSNGKIDGTWTQHPQPLNDDDGGHAMIFEDLDGILRISYHAPNNDSRIVIRRIQEENGALAILPE
ncbi:MAG: glycoside hydrolase family 43 protein [Dysgonamonadaceae bacterium]|nr:glycoside hydrolase family 43 protein [Dysgonamonadaceae bacterium]